MSKLKLADILGLAALSREAKANKPWMYQATCTPGVRDNREEEMAIWIDEVLGRPEGTGAVAARDGHVFLEFPTDCYFRPKAARALAARLLHAADVADLQMEGVRVHANG